MTAYGTQARATPDNYRYAVACLQQGMSYQSAARAAGVNEIDLREIAPGFSTAVRDAPPPQVRSPFERCSSILPEASAKELARIAALALNLLADKASHKVASQVARSVVEALPQPREVVPHRVTSRDVIVAVADLHALPLGHFLSEKRTRDVARPRQIAMYALRELCPHLSWPEIGRRLGNRDHTTIMHGVRKVKDLMAVDGEFADTVERTMKAVRARVCA